MHEEHCKHGSCMLYTQVPLLSNIVEVPVSSVSNTLVLAMHAVATSACCILYNADDGGCIAINSRIMKSKPVYVHKVFCNVIFIIAGKTSVVADIDTGL